ncbi:MAG: TPM domain-containing protein [Acidobacteriota bacterium]
MRKLLILLLASLALLAAAPAADVLRAPEGQYSDAARILPAEAARSIRTRQDFFTRATGCPLYIATLPSADGANLADRAQEVLTRWHATEKRLPDESILLLAFAAERESRLVLGPAIPKEYEEALAGLPPLTWTDSASAGREIDELINELDRRLEAPAEALHRRRPSFLSPVPRSFVLDGSGRFSDADRDRLERDLAALAKSSGHTIIAAIDPPGLTLALGDFSNPDVDRWVDAAFEQWRRDRPELETGAVLFAFTAKGWGSIACGKKVEGLLPKKVSLDLARDVWEGLTGPNSARTIVRVASTLDERFAGRNTVSVHSPLWVLLHPARVFTGPDEKAPLFFGIVGACLLFYLLGFYLYLWITEPKTMLFQLAGFAIGGVIGGALSKVAGETLGEAGGKFVGGMGFSGGGGASGSW